MQYVMLALATSSKSQQFLFKFEEKPMQLKKSTNTYTNR